jgi:hypothetical protein
MQGIRLSSIPNPLCDAENVHSCGANLRDHFYQSYDAQYKFGSGHMGGVIQVITKN